MWLVPVIVRPSFFFFFDAFCDRKHARDAPRRAAKVFWTRFAIENSRATRHIEGEDEAVGLGKYKKVGGWAW